VVTLQEAVDGWHKGDRIILTATTRQNKREKTFKPSTRDDTQTEERTIVSVDRDQSGVPDASITCTGNGGLVAWTVSFAKRTRGSRAAALLGARGGR
jgi:hypothetical protein